MRSSLDFQRQTLTATLIQLHRGQGSDLHYPPYSGNRPITREDEHRALLALAQQLPGLREVDFEVNGWWWERRRDNTWTQKYVFSCGVRVS
jgi:hypothetical protein